MAKAIRMHPLLAMHCTNRIQTKSVYWFAHIRATKKTDKCVCVCVCWIDLKQVFSDDDENDGFTFFSKTLRFQYFRISIWLMALETVRSKYDVTCIPCNIFNKTCLFFNSFVVITTWREKNGVRCISERMKKRKKKTIKRHRRLRYE